MSVDEFRNEVLATAHSYGDIRNLKQKVITPIIKYINSFTSYRLNMTQRYQGRTTTQLIL